MVQMVIKEKEFVEIEYTGRIKSDDIIFDTTEEKIAKENKIHNPNMPYGPITVCVGTGSVLIGLEKSIIGKEIGKSYKIELSPENAFGKKDAKLLKIVNKNVFIKSNINPVPGLQVNIDGITGVIKNVTGGRTVVDFNHPLSGKGLVYDLKINRLVTDAKEKIVSLVSLQFNLKPEAFEVKIDEKNVAGIKFKEGIKLKNFNTGMATEMMKELVGLNDVVYFETEKSKPNKD